MEDIVASFYAQGMRKLIILSGHGGNNFKGMIRDLAFVYPDFLIIAADWFSIVPPKTTLRLLSTTMPASLRLPL